MLAINAGILNIPATNAYYNDTEKSSENIFAAEQLDFAITAGPFDPLESSLNFNSGKSLSKQIDLKLEPESEAVDYFASTTNVSGDLDFCDQIFMNASLNDDAFGSGSLTNFKTATTTAISTTTADIWKFDFSIAASSTNSICSFDIGYNGKQIDPYIENGGFWDEEKESNEIYSWGFRINKIYYNVASDRGSDPSNEWVEIYNQTDQDLDLSGWQICDNSECDTIPSSPLIPAKGFGVITASSTTWNYWKVTDNVIPILLNDSRIGGGLNNDGDMLILKRPDGVVIDEMNWKNNINIWNPGAINVAKGHTLGRKPNGYDTNHVSDFVDLSPPVLNLINPNQSGAQTWYWTYRYGIQWLATNPNGSNDEIKIDLSYIKDTDHSGTITPIDEEISIVKGLANSGTYNWTVPSGFIGYIWIKIVAFGPENPMLNSQMTSGKVYDPYPVELLLTDPMAVLEGVLDSFTASSTATTTEVATTTPESAESGVGDTATTTGEMIVSEEAATGNDENAATTTEEIIPIGNTEETATTTEEIAPIENEEEVIEETSEEEGTGSTESVGGVNGSIEAIIEPEPDVVTSESEETGDGEPEASTEESPSDSLESSSESPEAAVISG